MSSNVKHIVQFSGGKDSTCMLLMMLEKGMQVDEIICCDTGKEFPQMYDHIKKVDQYIKEKYGKHITFLKAEKSFNYWMFDYVRQRGNYKGSKGYNWARAWMRWCTRVLKQTPTKKYLKEAGEYINYIGIAFDEPKRHLLMTDRDRHPLFDWTITEKQALQYCYEHGFDWGGLYEDFDRVSCWCCPLQPLKSLRTLYHKYPDLWEKLKAMDKKAAYSFKPNYSVEQLEERFKKEDEEKQKEDE